MKPSITELLTLLEAMKKGVAGHSVEDFYFLSRACLVKDESKFDRYDTIFAAHFQGLEDAFKALVEALPEDWLQKQVELMLTEEERKQIEAIGGFEALMDALKQRLDEQDERHEGGNKWIGTAGTSPFGAYGYNPEGVRIGQDKSRHQRAVKVWDKREFKNLDDSVELGTRNIKVALKRLRRWAREGAEDELDLNGTIRATAENGYLDIKTRPERRNAVKVLLFLDVGGSMDPYIKLVEELFSAAKTEFKHLEYFYFHNCLYEGVWRDNARRWTEQQSTIDIMNTYGPDYKCIFVGDASMSPYEIAYAGGANEHWNAEAGQVWLNRATEAWKHNVWINPLPEKHWKYTHSIQMIRELFGERMFPMTLKGIEQGMKDLVR